MRTLAPANDEPEPADAPDTADDEREPVDRPADQSSAPASHSRGSRWAPVTTVLHLHLSEDALQALAHAKAHGGHPAGVGRLEGHGPLSLPEALELLQLSQVVIRPVLDPWVTAPVDSYAFTGNLREAVLARVPTDCYPYGVNTTHAMDIDHTRAYDPGSHDTGGSPGQTSVENAGPMTRNHHRIKTHGQMSVRQPVPDTYVWRTTHHRYCLVDGTGTHDLDPRIGALVFSDHRDDREHAALLLTTGLDLGMEETEPDDWQLIA